MAKLRLHHDLTLRKLENATTQMADQFRIFATETCSEITTYELKSEQEARQRRNQHSKVKGSKLQSTGAPTGSADAMTSPASRRRKVFSIQTYKFHAVGDYVETIRKFGTVDSYSTEVVSSSHKLLAVVDS